MTFTRQTLLWVEWVIFFMGVPLAVAQGWLPFNKLLLLLGAGLLCLIYLLLDKSFDNKRLLGVGSIRLVWKSMLLRIVLCVALLLTVAYLFYPEVLFAFAKRNPRFWGIVLVLYPLASALPQELIYRAFMFQRYAKILGKGHLMIIASATAFAYLHIIYINWQGLLLSFSAGIVFALSYKKTERLFPTWLEHSIYGNLVFTIGLGIFFYRVI